MKKNPKGARLRIYWRNTGASRRAYGDFRPWADVGGAREPLVPSGGNTATTDPKEAEQLYLARAAELNDLRKKREVLGAVYGISRPMGLQEFAAHHLRLKAESGRVTYHSVRVSEMHLQVAVDFFGARKELHEIRVPEVQAFATWLAQQPVGRGKPGVPGKVTLSPGTQRKYLNSLSNMFQRAQAENVVTLGHNPISLLIDKPIAARKEASWLESHDAALLLESARTYKPKRYDIAMPYAHALLATFLLTGGRTSEVLGLEVEDLSFDRKAVTFRPNRHRRLKTLASMRTVPMWPQLEAILREYVFGGQGPTSGLLFPSLRTGQVKMLTDVRKMLDAIAERAGWRAGEIRSKMFRYTYASARLQTTDRGEAVSQFTVSRELGHGGDSLVKRVYGHLGTVRHRAEQVEFRVADHAGVLSDRLTFLESAAR